MKTLCIDIESFSSCDLTKCGVYKYAEAEDFEILLFSYSIDGGKVQTIDIANGERIPQEIIDALTDDNVIKHAHNAAFERICLSKYLGFPLGEYLSPYSWRCDMIWAATLGLPLSLENVGKILGLEKQKMTEGKALIRYFCVPCKPTKVNGGRTRNLPHHAPDKWELFKEYNKRDVETELEIQAKLSKFPPSEELWEEYHTNEEINDCGILVDMDFVEQAIAGDEISRQSLTEKMTELTQLENPNSVMQMKEWLAKNGLEVDTLGKEAVKELLKTAPQKLAKVLELRQELAKSSVKKYTAMMNVACKDNRVRGMFQFYGANRSGRFAGRLVQLQNLTKNYIPDLENARNLIKAGEFEMVDILYGSTPNVLSELVRTAFIPPKGKKYIVADFSAIEARVLSWLAGEKWRMDVFAENGDIYCATASKMFHCNVVKNGENGHLRQKGKQAELACIAEGELVLTDKGLVPIENITLSHKLWDGENWVTHNGVICNGIKEVIEYDGLRATKDHLVWVDGYTEPIQFGMAALKGLCLIQIFDMPKSKFANVGKVRVYDIRNAGINHRFTVSGKLVHNCGYGGSIGAMKAMGAIQMGMNEEELKPLVDAWRAANPNIVKLWYDVDRATKNAVKNKTSETVRGVVCFYKSGILFIKLPSGRCLSYVKPQIGENRFGGESVTYEGTGDTKKWERLESYGAKFVENIVQGIARDILCYAMKTLKNCNIVAHVHDEVIIEADKRMSVEAVCELMSRTPPWAEGLLLKADGYECQFYKKE